MKLKAKRIVRNNKKCKKKRKERICERKRNKEINSNCRNKYGQI